MDFEASEDEALFVDTVRIFCRDNVDAQAGAWDEAGRVPAEVLAGLGELGLFGLELDEARGGVGLSTAASAAIIEELAASSGSLALLVSAHNFLVVAHVLRSGRDALLPALASGARVGAWALTEKGSGSDAASARTLATRDGDAWVLTGAKAYVTAGSHAGSIVVFATTDPDDRRAGLTAFLVDGDALG